MTLFAHIEMGARNTKPTLREAIDAATENVFPPELVRIIESYCRASRVGGRFALQARPHERVMSALLLPDNSIVMRSAMRDERSKWSLSRIFANGKRTEREFPHEEGTYVDSLDRWFGYVVCFWKIQYSSDDGVLVAVDVEHQPFEILAQIDFSDVQFFTDLPSNSIAILHGHHQCTIVDHFLEQTHYRLPSIVFPNRMYECGRQGHFILHDLSLNMLYIWNTRDGNIATSLRLAPETFHVWSCVWRDEIYYMEKRDVGFWPLNSETFVIMKWKPGTAPEDVKQPRDTSSFFYSRNGAYQTHTLGEVEVDPDCVHEGRFERRVPPLCVQDGSAYTVWMYPGYVACRELNSFVFYRLE